MGFDCGFSRVKRMKNCSLADYLNTQLYLEWKNNPWNFEDGHYPTYEKYCEDFYSDNSLCVIPSQEMIDFYSVETEEHIFSWGGWSFSDVDHQILSILKPFNSSDYFRELNEDNKQDLIKYLNEVIDDNRLEEKYICRSFLIPKDGDEDDDYIIKRIDGVLLADDSEEELNFNLHYTAIPIFVEKKNGNYYLANKLEVLKAKLEMIDLNNYFVYYWNSY